MPASWRDPRLAIRPSALHGRGTFATAFIAAGETVSVWEHRVLLPSDVGTAPPGELWSRRDGTHVWVPPNDPTTAEHLLNHSCDPNVWMSDEVTLVARRDIGTDEELTADYALWELDPTWVARFRCRCGASMCRDIVTGRDWESPDLQQRYAGHFHPVLADRIVARCSPPCAPGDGEATAREPVARRGACRRPDAAEPALGSGPARSNAARRSFYLVSQVVLTSGTWKLNVSPCTSLRYAIRRGMTMPVPR